MKKLISLTLLLLALIVPQSVKAMEMPFDLNGFYVSGNASCNFLSHDREHGAKVTFDPGYFLAPAIGYRFCNGFRVEGEFGYRHNCLKRLKFYGTSFHVSGKFETYSGLANVYYDLPMCWCLKPYIGAGIGYAYTKATVHGDGYYSGSSSSSSRGHRSGFAWQVIAGVAYPICENIDLAVEYRFFRNERICRVQNNDIGASVRYYF